MTNTGHRRHVAGLLADSFSYKLVTWINARRKRTGEFHRIVVPIDDVIGMRVVATGRYEATQIDALRTLIASSAEIVGRSIDPNGIFLDIGANIGLYSVAFCQSFRRVVAFEPNPIAYKVLEANIALSHAGNVLPICTGVSDAKGQATLYVPRDGNLGWATTHQVHADPDEITIDLDSLDNLATAHGFDTEPVTLMKIDVEGNEAEVLRGCTRMLTAWAPIVVFELLDAALGRASVDVLRDCGYAHFYTFRRSLKSAKSGFRGYVDSLAHGLPISFDEVDLASLPRAALVCAVRRP